MERKQAIARELPHLRRYARALLGEPGEADDLVQDTVLRALEKIDQWRSGDNPRLWLFTIMHNRFVDGGRARSRRPAVVPIEAGAADISEPPRQVEQLVFADVMNALQGLPEDRREAVVLVGVEGLSYRDAATVTGVPVGTLMSRLGRGREELRSLLGENPRTPRVVSVRR